MWFEGVEGVEWGGRRRVVAYNWCCWVKICVSCPSIEESVGAVYHKDLRRDFS